MLKHIDKWGGPETFPHMAAGWAWPATRLSSGPSRWPPTSAARATAWSCSWPKRIKAKGEMRSQFHHVIDIAPTVLEAAGLPEPKNGQRRRADADGRRQHGLHLRRRQGRGAGTRRSTSRCSATAPSTTTAGWPPPCTRPPGKPTPRRKLAEDVWELYNVDEDFSEANDLAASNPAKLKELQALFMKEAEQVPRAAD